MTKHVKAVLEQVNQHRRKFLGMLLAGAAAAPILTTTAFAATGLGGAGSENKPLKQKAAAAPLKANKPASKVVKAPAPPKDEKKPGKKGGKK